MEGYTSMDCASCEHMHLHWLQQFLPKYLVIPKLYLKKNSLDISVILVLFLYAWAILVSKTFPE